MDRSRILQTVLVSSFVALLGVSITSGIVSTLNVQSVYRTADAVAHSFAVKAALEQLLATLVEAETRERGFIITGEASYLAPYDRVLVGLSPVIARLRTLTVDNRDQQTDLDRLSSLVQVKVGELAEAIRQRRESGPAAAQALVVINVAKHTTDDMRGIVGGMEAREDALLVARAAQAAHSYNLAFITTFIITGLSLIMAVALFAGARRTAKDRLRAIESAERLRVTLASIGDAMIAIDAKDRVSFMNPVAETLTGWNQAEAIGRKLEEVFVIVDERTREPAEAPALRSMREGGIVGLANHTVLIAKNGAEIPIDDSGSAIHGPDGTVSGAVLIFRDITERRQAERLQAELFNRERLAYQAERAAREAAETAELRMKLALEAGQMGTWEYRITTGKVAWSSGLEQIHGYPPGTFAGSFEVFRDEIHPDDREYVVQAIRETIRQQRDYHVEYRIARLDGSVRWVEGRGQAFLDAAGQPDYLMGVCTDITERRRTAEAERQATRAAEEANRAKDEFLAMVSHELRNPLSAIIGWAGLLRNGNMPPERAQQAYEVIERNAQTEARLVESLLDLSQIVAGKLKLVSERVDLPALLESVVDSIRPAADAKMIQLEMAAPGEIEVIGDSGRLQQIFSNLLTNAVKFTPRGGHIAVRVMHSAARVQIQVLDDGDGIDSDFLPHIFERFRQAESTTKSRQGGLGLGLAIVRELVHAHEGTITAESLGKGLGSTLTVTLPIAAPIPVNRQAQL